MYVRRPACANFNPKRSIRPPAMEYPNIPVFWLDQGEVRERSWGYSHLHTDHYQSSEHAGVRKAKETSETDTDRKWDYNTLTRSSHLRSGFRIRQLHGTGRQPEQAGTLIPTSTLGSFDSNGNGRSGYLTCSDRHRKNLWDWHALR